MAGMGESWFSTCVGTQEVDIDNVRLDISDASPIVTVNPTPTPTSTGTSSSNTGTSATAAPSKTLSPTPQKTTNPTNQATNSPTAPATATPTPYIQRTELPLWVTVLAAVVLAVCVKLCCLLGSFGVGRGEILNSQVDRNRGLVNGYGFCSYVDVGV
jgi:hypothetical protein